MLVNTIHPPEDDPYFKPMEIKRAKSSKPSSSGPENFAQFCGPKSSTRRNDGKADITIKFDGKSFKAHKHVMREASELFEKEPAFQHYKKSKTYNLNSVNVLPEGCKPEIVKKVFDFAYTGRLPTYPANDFLDFFNVAVALHFHEALCIYDVQFNQLFKGAFRTVSTKVAANLISQAQKIRKPIQLSRCAEHLELIFDDTCKYLLKEPVDKLISDNDFLQDMSADGMEAFLDRDDLAKPEEENKVLDLVLAWVKYDQINRKMHAEKVMKKVHLGLLPRNRLTTLCSEMCWSPECKELIEKVLKLMDSKEEVGVPLEYSHYQWFGTRSEMFCDTMIGINPGGQAMVYFNTYGPQNRQGWQDWCGFQSIPI
ncbi:kelch-like protein 25 isoform X2 [Amphiura filiformis]|uniref:kelch-like protein 25 isoform X2 n=1 Tax=Amphiura filiformis TaxID=82378 RepID=UPI003B20B8FB